MKNDDIADPYVVIRNLKDAQKSAVYEATLPYFKRSLEIDIVSNLTRPSGKKGVEYQLCVLARDSKTFIRGFNGEQCRVLPNSSGANRPYFVYSSNITTIIIIILLLDLKTQL